MRLQLDTTECLVGSVANGILLMIILTFYRVFNVALGCSVFLVLVCLFGFVGFRLLEIEEFGNSIGSNYS